jgi:hypothetical protein
MKTLLKILLSTMLGALLLVIVTASLSCIYEKEIIDAVLKSLSNNHIYVQMQHIKIAMPLTFPITKIQAEHVRLQLHPRINTHPEFDVATEHAYITINLFKLLMSQTIDVKNISISDGEAKIILPQNIDYQNMDTLLKNIHVLNMQNFRIFVEKNIVDVEHIKLEIHRSKTKIFIDMDGKIILVDGKIYRMNPILKKPIEANIHATINDTLIEILNSYVTIINTPILFNANISTKTFNLNAKSDNIQLEHIAQYFIVDTLFQKMKGNLHANVQVKGAIGNMPMRINAQVKVKDAFSLIRGQLVNVSTASLGFTSSDATNLKEYCCNIADANINLNEFKVQAKGKINNFEIPRANVEALVEGKITELTNIFEGGFLSGNINADFYTNNLEIENIKGKLQLNDASATFWNKNINGEATIFLNTQYISIYAKNLKCNDADANLKVKVYNYMALWQKDNKENVQIMAKLSAQNINADTLMNLKIKPNKENLPKVKLKLNVNSHKLLFNY